MFVLLTTVPVVACSVSPQTDEQGSGQCETSVGSGLDSAAALDTETSERSDLLRFEVLDSAGKDGDRTEAKTVEPQVAFPQLATAESTLPSGCYLDGARIVVCESPSCTSLADVYPHYPFHTSPEWNTGLLCPENGVFFANMSGVDAVWQGILRVCPDSVVLHNGDKGSWRVYQQCALVCCDPSSCDCTYAYPGPLDKVDCESSSVCPDPEDPQTLCVLRVWEPEAPMHRFSSSPEALAVFEELDGHEVSIVGHYLEMYPFWNDDVFGALSSLKLGIWPKYICKE